MFTCTCSRMQTRMRTHASTHFFLDRFDPVILEHTPPVIIAICRYAICRRISCPYCTVVYHFSNLIQHDRVCTAIWLRITYLSTSRQSCWNCNLCVRACRAVCAVSACACRACVRPCVQVCMRAHTCMCMRHCFFFFPTSRSLCCPPIAHLPTTSRYASAATERFASELPSWCCPANESGCPPAALQSTFGCCTAICQRASGANNVLNRHRNPV